jgi:hypothetical protein
MHTAHRNARGIGETKAKLISPAPVEHVERSRSQFATLNSSRGSNGKYVPRAFTEHGAIHPVNVQIVLPQADR